MACTTSTLPTSSTFASSHGVQASRSTSRLRTTSPANDCPVSSPRRKSVISIRHGCTMIPVYRVKDLPSHEQSISRPQSPAEILHSYSRSIAHPKPHMWHMWKLKEIATTAALQRNSADALLKPFQTKSQAELTEIQRRNFANGHC